MSRQIETQTLHIGQEARRAASVLSLKDNSIKNKALHKIHEVIKSNVDRIIDANALDLKNAQVKGLSSAKIDRLMLNQQRVLDMADSVACIADFDDPVGQVLEEWKAENGLHFVKVSVPIGVIGMIYESRPNVTADAAALCLKSGNAVILRAGSDSQNSSQLIAALIGDGLAASDLPRECVQILDTPDRSAVKYLLRMSEYVDVIIPRGSRSLIERVQEEATMPVFSHLEGLCHIYIDSKCNIEMAHDVVLNAKLRRTGICGSLETLLVHQDELSRSLPKIVKDLLEQGCELRGDAHIAKLDKRIKLANEQDWDTEYLDAILSIKTVDSIDSAIAHIGLHGSHHTDSIITDNQANADRFLQNVDSSIVMHNVSTQYADGGEFGMGSEIGIATGRMHARGPIGIRQLTCFKYKVIGNGHCRG